MTLDWTTFILEIINFLILIWLLAHFLYKPVLAIITRRREEIEHKLADAESLRWEAENIKSQYEGRLTDWQQEKSEARQKLHREINRERENLMKDLEQELEQEREKSMTINQRRLEEESRKNEKQALEQGTCFTSRLLAGVAGPELESSIIRLAIDNLNNYSDEQKKLLRNTAGKGDVSVKITTAFKLGSDIRKEIETTLSTLVGKPVQFDYKQNTGLLAGVRIDIGSWELLANLRDELKSFSDSYHG